MIIGIAGPYSALTEEQRTQNLSAINAAAVAVYERGHIPFVGMNMALPVVAGLRNGNVYDAIMNISMAVIDNCDALLFIGKSPGANKERDLMLAKGLPVYYSIDEIP